MPAAIKHEVPHYKESSLFALLSGWGQQGMQALFTTQRILLDLAMRQNASVMHAVRQQLSDPHHSPAAILNEVAETSVANFLEGQQVLLELGRQQNDILMTAVKERVGDTPARSAIVQLLQRSVDTFIQMNEEYLKIVGKQTRTWLHGVKAGKAYEPEQLVNLTRDGMETFIKAQKRFLDVLAEETAKATSGKHANGARKGKPAEFAEIAQQATKSIIDAQKQLVDTAGHQMDANVKAVGKTLELLKPFPFLPLNELTREAVKSYVDAQRALMDVMVKAPIVPKSVAKAVRPARRAPKKAQAAVAVA